MNKRELINYYKTITNNNLSIQAIEIQLDKLKEQYPYMTYGGIQYTLWYIVNYKQLSIQSLWIIPHIYKEAEEYYDKQQKIKHDIKQWKDENRIINIIRKRKQGDIFI